VAQDVFLLLAVALLGVYALGWTRRLAEPWTELPVKSLAAAALAGAVVVAELTGTPVDAQLRTIVLVLATPFVAGPLLVVGLARARRYAAADGVVDALYWSEAGREALRRVVVQSALQHGDADAALVRLPRRDDAAMRAQALAAKGDWQAVLALDGEADGDPGYLADGARVQALLALGRLPEAAEVVAAMRARFERGPQGPIGYRNVTLAETRLEAERGNLRKVRETLQQPLVGVAPDELYALLARAAEVAGERGVATRVYQEAARAAPPGRRGRYQARLEAWGEAVPAPLRSRRARRATLGLAGVLGLAYVGQASLDLSAGAYLIGNVPLQASSVAAAFGLGLPGFPFADAWWRYLSYAFVHAGIVHIGFNLWVLYDLGRVYEARRSWGDLLAAFVVGTAMGAYLTSIVQAGATLILVGASGGVLGVAGALLADVLRSREPHDRALTRSLLQWMALITLLSLVIPNVSLWGHVGGVVGGMLWAFVRQGLPADRRVSTGAGVIAVGALAAAVVQVLRVVVALP
jgi:rhomboid protease GluP